MRKLAAFTLLEGVLSLLLLAILGVFATYALQAIVRSAGSLAGRGGQEQEILYFCTALRVDLDQARSVHSEAGTDLLCVMDSGAVHYASGREGILRADVSGDTTWFMLPIASSEAFTIADGSDLVHLWRLRLLAPEGRELYLHKTYSTADRLRANAYHVHEDTSQP